MKILFVEDDALNRRVVRDMLSVVGAEMEEAPDAECGLRMIDANDYAVILMDLRMPGMDGLEAIRHIRARGDQKGMLPIIVVTADMAVDLHQQCFDSGADDVIEKPVGMGALIDAMGRMLAKASSGPVILN